MIELIRAVLKLVCWVMLLPWSFIVLFYVSEVITTALSLKSSYITSRKKTKFGIDPVLVFFLFFVEGLLIGMVVYG